MLEGLVITTDKEKIMDDTKVDEVVSEVDGMKSFKLVVKSTREYYTTVIVDATDKGVAEEGFMEDLYTELNETDWTYWDILEMDVEQVTEMGALDEEENDFYLSFERTTTPRFTYKSTDDWKQLND